MAEEEKETIPAYIDYFGDSDTEPVENYTGRQVQDYWRKQLVKKHRTSALPLTIKEKTLWKRLITKYPAEDLVKMIDYWMNIAEDVSNFGSFYNNSKFIHKHVQEKDYTWE